MTKEGLIFSVLKEMGIDILQGNIIADQDLDKFTLLEQRQNIQQYINNFGFDLINDCKLTEILFQYFLAKIYLLEERYFPVYYLVEGPNPSKRALEIKNTIEGYRSEFYTIDSLRFIDLIFKLNGDLFVDLSHYDIK